MLDLVNMECATLAQPCVLAKNYLVQNVLTVGDIVIKQRQYLQARRVLKVQHLDQ